MANAKWQMKMANGKWQHGHALRHLIVLVAEFGDLHSRTREMFQFWQLHKAPQTFNNKCRRRQQENRANWPEI